MKEKKLIISKKQKKEVKNFYHYCRLNGFSLKSYIDISRAAYDYIQETSTDTAQAFLAMSLLAKKRGHRILDIIRNDHIIKCRTVIRP